MGIEVARRALVDRWRMLAWWAGGTVVYLALIALWWPSVRDNDKLQDTLQDYPVGIQAMFGGEEAFDVSTPAGFLQVQLFALLVPVALSVFTIGFAAQTLAGEEEDGLLDMLLAHPLSRRATVLEKGLAITLGVLGLALLGWLTLVGMDAAVDLEVDAVYLLAAVMGAVLLALFHGAAALLAGALTGHRGFAVAGGTLAFGVGFVLMMVSELADDADWLRYLSPYYYGTGTDALTESWPVGSHTALAVLVAATVAGAVNAFERRNLRT